MKSSQKSIPYFLISFVLHAFIVWFIWNDASDVPTLWSGGGSSNPSDVVFIELGTISESAEEVEVIAESKAQKVESSIAEKGLINKSKTKNQTKMSQEKSNPKTTQKATLANGHTFDPNGSNTPNTGSGLGLDAIGTISTNAPSVLAKIRKKIYSKKVYPLLAKENKITGKVGVIFQINQDGSLAYVNIRKSSGQKILDDAALKAVQKSAPLPYYPVAISTTIEYELKD